MDPPQDEVPRELEIRRDGRDADSDQPGAHGCREKHAGKRQRDQDATYPRKLGVGCQVFFLRRWRWIGLFAGHGDVVLGLET